MCTTICSSNSSIYAFIPLHIVVSYMYTRKGEQKMAVFTRQEALVGDSAYRVMLSGSDADSTAYTGSIIRLMNSDMVKISGVYTSGHTSKFTPTSRGRRIQASKTSTTRTIVLNFVSGDSSGFEQSAIKAFFTYDRKITYTDPERKISSMSLWVISIDDQFFGDGNDSISITCTAEYDDINASREVVLYTYEGTTWPTINVSLTNPLSVDASIRLKVGTTDGSTIKFRNSKITLSSTGDDATSTGSITYICGIDGIDNSYTGAAITVDSVDEIVAGKAIIDVSSTQKFFIIPPYETATITAIMTDPFPIDGTASITVSAYYTAPQGMYANGFSIKTAE